MAPDGMPRASLASSSSRLACCLKLALRISLSILLLRRLSSSLCSSSSRPSGKESLSIWCVSLSVFQHDAMPGMCRAWKEFDIVSIVVDCYLKKMVPRMLA